MNEPFIIESRRITLPSINFPDPPNCCLPANAAALAFQIRSAIACILCHQDAPQLLGVRTDVPTGSIGRVTTNPTEINKDNSRVAAGLLEQLILFCIRPEFTAHVMISTGTLPEPHPSRQQQQAHYKDPPKSAHRQHLKFRTSPQTQSDQSTLYDLRWNPPGEGQMFFFAPRKVSTPMSLLLRDVQRRCVSISTLELSDGQSGRLGDLTAPKTPRRHSTVAQHPENTTILFRKADFRCIDTTNDGARSTANPVTETIAWKPLQKMAVFCRGRLLVFDSHIDSGGLRYSAPTFSPPLIVSRTLQHFTR